MDRAYFPIRPLQGMFRVAALGVVSALIVTHVIDWSWVFSSSALQTPIGDKGALVGGCLSLPARAMLWGVIMSFPPADAFVTKYSPHNGFGTKAQQVCITTFLPKREKNECLLQSLSAMSSRFKTQTQAQASETTVNSLYHQNLPVESGKEIHEMEYADDTEVGAQDENESSSIAKNVYQQVNKKAQNNGARSMQPLQQSATAGLSKFHRSLLSPTAGRQRFVTGRYPLHITVQENPTRKWFGQLGSKKRNSATSQILVNGTSVDRSLASHDRFQWLDDDDDDEREELHRRFSLVSLELIAEIHVKNPGYVNILPAYGAGSTAAARHVADAHAGGAGWNRWTRNSVFFEKLEEAMTSRRPEQERLWITGFSLTKNSGELHCVDVESGRMGTVNSRTADAIRWPNEVNNVPVQSYDNIRHSAESSHPNDSSSRSNAKNEELEDALLVSDGFLVPGKDKGGLYVVRNPGNDASEWRVCLTGSGKGRNKEISKDEDWFYHRAVWVDLTGDGRKSILTARAKRPSILSGKGSSTQPNIGRPSKGQLVWLERPKPHRYHEATGTPLDIDDTVFDPFCARNTPWKVRVLDEGPDVMFCLADLDTTDDTLEVISSQFFSRTLSLHSIQVGPRPRVSFRRTIDDRVGASFSSILANLDGDPMEGASSRAVVDCGSTVSTLKAGDAFSHVLVTSHECTFADKYSGFGAPTLASSRSLFQEVQGEEELVESDIRMGSDDEDVKPESMLVSSVSSKIDGGSLFAYRVPSGRKDAWKTDPWVRSVIATGFRVRGQLGNMINPGAPGFCYTFYPTRDDPSNSSWSRPLIGISGDCAEAAYILRPVEEELTEKQEGNEMNGWREANNNHDPSTNYALMCEIECGATVGSIAIGYDDFCATFEDPCLAEQQKGYAKIYVPCYEKDKVLVFAMANGEDDHVNTVEDDDNW